MKILYLETKRKESQDLKDSVESGPDLAQLPKTLLLVYSIQYKELAQTIKTRLEKNKFKITGFQQVLGCSKLKSSVPILLIGSGRFHALNLALQNPVPIYIYTSSKLERLNEKDLESFKLKKQGAFSKFLHASKIGIIISAKPGQEYMNKALSFKEIIKSKYKDKQVFLFISSNINLNELENFNVDFWVNTACPGLSYDSNKIINYDDIIGFLG
jgi:diphthamide biosynthesis enzyme Dph1/Dph2-like protein